MKKILLALALAASVQFSVAQDYASEKKAIDKAVEAAQNPKKATKAATWLKLGEAYLKAYDAQMGNIWIGATQQELTLIGLKPISIEEYSAAGATFQKLVLADKNVYVSMADGGVAAVEITKPVVPDLLDKSAEAYAKAFELEGAKVAKNVSEALQKISVRYNSEALGAFNLKDMVSSSEKFEKSAIVSESQPLASVDTNAVYNAAFAASLIPDHARACKFFKKCYDLGYYSENGHVFTGLADALMHSGDTVKAVSYLEEGFLKFPQSQGIMIGLINYYINKGTGTDRVFELLDKAKVNEPDNASLYYVEGNTYVQIKDYEKAIAAYDKCSEINPEYEFGYIGKGLMYSNLANDAAIKARDEMDDKKYNEYVAEFEKNTRACIEPLEKAFEVTKDDGIRSTIAEMLRSAYYRFRDESPEYQAAYEKYDKIVKEGL